MNRDREGRLKGNRDGIGGGGNKKGTGIGEGRGVKGNRDSRGRGVRGELG